MCERLIIESAAYTGEATYRRFFLPRAKPSRRGEPVQRRRLDSCSQSHLFAKSHQCITPLGSCSMQIFRPAFLSLFLSAPPPHAYARSKSNLNKRGLLMHKIAACSLVDVPRPFRRKNNINSAIARLATAELRRDPTKVREGTPTRVLLFPVR